MNRRVSVLATHLANFIPETASLKGLDVGCGSGEVGLQLMESRPRVSLTGVDVLVRSQTAIPVKQFDGKTLPFGDNSFDFVLLVDVLHHTRYPAELLAECDRVSRQFILIKDHNCNSNWDRLRLRFMDWVGNRSYGVALPYNYLSSLQWQQLYQQVGTCREGTIANLNLYPVPLSWIFDASLHFVDRMAVKSVIAFVG